MSEDKVALTIIVKKPDGGVEEVELDRKSITIGSGSTADLKVEGEGVSVSHAVLECRDDGVFITDLATPTGTFVNDEKITKKRLAAGDNIRIGAVHMELSSGEEQPAEQPVEEPVPEAAAEEPAPEPVAEEAAAAEEAPAEEPAAEEPVKEEEPVQEAAEEPAAEKKDGKKKKKEKKSEVASVGVELDKSKILAAKKKSRIRRRFTFDMTPSGKKQEVIEGKPILEVREIGWMNICMSVNEFTKGSINVGENISNTYFLPQEMLPSDPFTLASTDGDNASIYFTDKQSGSLITRDGEKDILQAATKQGNSYALNIKPGQAAHVHFGDMSYYFRFINKESVPAMPLSQRFNYGELAIWIIAYALWALLIYQVSIQPEPEVADILDGPDRTPEAIVDVEEEEEEPEEVESLVDNNMAPAKAMGEEGKIGDEKSILDKADGSARRALAEELAESSGLLGALDDGTEGRDKMFDGAIDESLAENLGTLEGPTGVDARGAGGLGARGSGFGGGGTALGIGGLGTRGRGSGKGRFGIGAAGKLKRRGGMAKVSGRGASVQGSLDRSIIAKIIKKHLNQIRHCYQKELNKNPNLYGKIVIKFTIGGNGRVTRASVANTTMRNVSVEDCVARVIKHIMFPKPKGGGIVVVSYPFVFKPV